MKKLVAIIITLSMLVTLSTTAFAVVESPVTTGAPTVVGDQNITISSYSDRDKLEASIREIFEKAYGELMDADDLTKICKALADLAEQYGIPASSLAIRDFFDISATEEKDKYEIKLNVGEISGFVAIIHYENGEWVLVKNAQVSGTTLEFTVDSLSPFAIVVNKDGGDNIAPDKVSPLPFILIGVGVVVVAGGVFAYFYITKKKKASDAQ